jgi:hypothetical protein
MNRNINILWYIAPIWALTACSGTVGELDDTAESTSSSQLIALNATRADAATTSPSTKIQKPCFVAWLESDITEENRVTNNSISTSPLLSAEPFFILNADKDIDAYKSTPYNTGCYYPTADQSIYVSGYYPTDSLKRVKNYDGGMYLELIEGTRPGLTDILVANNTLKGSASFPLDDADAGSLTFNHALAKVTFKGILHENMAKYVRNVTVSLSSMDLMRGLYAAYDSIQGQVFQPFAWAEEKKDITWSSQKYKKLLNKETIAELGTVYIVPGYSIMITVDYELSEKGETGEEYSSTFTVYFEKKLNGGDSYEVTLSFLENVIELTGERVEWQEGGELYIPLYPYKNSTNE